MTAAGGPPPRRRLLGPGRAVRPGRARSADRRRRAGNGLAAEVQTLERAIFEVKRIIVGQDQLVERMLVGLLSKGHVLLEGVPGVAKSLAVETFAKVVGGTFARIQFTPRPVPTDIIGTRIYRQGKEEFDTELGPVVVNFLLADEINRAPAKVQSALLEVMQERHVSIGGKTFPLPNPFLVMATQNPIEHEGVYPLPEAQRDRFLFKINVGYPSPEEEREIIYRMACARRSPSRSSTPATWSGCRTSRPTSSSTTRWSTTWCGWSRHPAPRTAGHERRQDVDLVSAPRRAPRWASSPGRGPWRWCAAATT
uniref:Transcriptional regulator n=1 Tax=Mycobacterium avium TaxID=1764 RepID=O07392_MYCAV|nr:transcriptional regulator [Mycobacterium avium]